MTRVGLAWTVSLGLLLAACGSANPHEPLRAKEYGKPTRDTVTVTVGGGFRRPGAYHVPAGTTVGDLIHMAEMLPDPGRGSELHMWSLKLSQSKNGFNSFNETPEERLRVTLEDQARLAVHKYNF
jgi:hypothetical protein